MEASVKAEAVAGAVRRARKPQKVGKDLKGDKSATSFVETTPQARRNARRLGQITKRDPLRGMDTLRAYKDKSSTGKVVKAYRDQQRNRRTMTDRVFRPMTRKQASAISAAMHDPGIPTRKLSPRP